MRICQTKVTAANQDQHLRREALQGVKAGHRLKMLLYEDTASTHGSVHLLTGGLEDAAQQ